MTDPVLDRLQELSGLTVEDALDGSGPEDLLHQLQAELLRFFPEHAHVADEFREIWSGGWPDPEIIPHGWVLELEGEPVGFTVFHTSLRRRVVLQHFVGIDREAGWRLPLRWVQYLADAVFETGAHDCQRHGTTLLAALGENHPEHARTWERYGYRTLDIEYREPNHGQHWRDFGPPTFFPMTPQIRLTDEGASLPYAQVVDAAVRAFLLDHYLLPEDEPTVARTLSLIAALPDPE